MSSSEPVTLSAALQAAVEALQAVAKGPQPVSETPRLDAQVLAAQILDRSRAWVLAHPEAVLSPEQAARFQAALARLAAGEPLPYVLGRWEFFGLEFAVTPAVLIPRPETELLVERALAWLERNPGRRLAADVGTGSACIAVSLAVHCPGLRLLATDVSAPALAVARQNAARHAVLERIEFIQADLLPPLGSPLDLICANLPYIPEDTLPGLRVSRTEPALALRGGQDGLDLIRRLLALAPGCLAPGGLALLEIEASQGPRALALARGHFPTASLQLIQDLAGRDRLLEIQA